MVVTSSGANQVDESNPSVIVTMPNDPSGRRVLSGFLFRSPVIEWARLRVVGLETCQVQSVYGGQAPANQISSPSPLPTSPIDVDGYDVGPGSGETGRYDPYAVTHSPPVPVPVQLVVDNGGWPLQWQVAFTQASPPVLGVGALPSPSLDFGIVEAGSSPITLQVTVSSLNKQIDLLSKVWSVSNYSDDAVVGPAFVVNAAPGTRVVNITFTPPNSAGLFSGTLRLRLQAVAPAPADIVDLFIAVSATVVQNRYYNNGKLYLLLKNLNIGGGANLLSQEGYIDGALYDSRLSHSPGLRALPELTSPNRAFIEAAIVGPQLATMTFSINLLCDVLDDDEFGTYVPGPYGRRDALLRSSVADPNSGVR